MAYYGSWKIDDLLTFCCNTHTVTTGAATDADSVPAYRVYEDETGTAILTGNMAKLDDAGTTGFYSEQITLSAANGFEKGKCYTVYISATVNSVAGTMHHSFQMEAEVDANAVSNIGAGVITAAAIATGAIDADAIADNAIDAGAIATDAITAAKIADGAIDAATFAASAITSTVLANDAITAAKLHADVTTELQSGLATAAALDAVDNFIDVEIQTIITMLTGIVPVNGTIGATANDTTHLHLSGLAYGDDGPNSMLILVKDVSAGIFVSRWIEDFANAGDLATVATLPFTPEASVDLYWILPVRADVTGGSGLDAAGVRAAVGLASASLDTQLGDLPTNAELSTALGTADDAVLSAINDLPTNAELATALGTADDAVLAQVALVKTETDKIASIKTKTDSLTFTVANQVDANLQSVNDAALTGDGAATPWGPA
jgi:hypothetical protein